MSGTRTFERLLLLNLGLITLVLAGTLLMPALDGRFVGPTVFWVSATVCQGLLQAVISLPRFERLQLRHRGRLFGLQLLLCFGVALAWYHPPAIAGYPIATALILFGPRIRWLLVAGLLAAVATLAYIWPPGHPSDVEGQMTVWWLAACCTTGLQIYVFAWMARLAVHLQATRQEVAQTSLDEERSRVRRDVHDLLGLSLTMITLRLEVALRVLRRGDARAELCELSELVEQALAGVRTVAEGTPITALSAELDSARAVLSWAGIEADVSVTGRPGAEAGGVLAFVVREAVTNMLRHSKATRCVIVASETGVRVANDGAAPSTRPPGSGLAGLRARVSPLGGDVDGELSDGWFTLTATIPAKTHRFRPAWQTGITPLLLLLIFQAFSGYLHPGLWNDAGPSAVAITFVVLCLMAYLTIARTPRLGLALTGVAVVSIVPPALGWMPPGEITALGAVALFALPRLPGLGAFAACALAGTWYQAKDAITDGVWPAMDFALLTITPIGQVSAQLMLWAALVGSRLVRQLGDARAELAAVTVAQERAQFGLHLRDRIGSSLFTVARAVDRAGAGPEPEAEITDAIRQTRDTIQEIRSIARQQAPVQPA